MPQSILSCGLIINVVYVIEIFFSKNTTIFHKISGNLPNKDPMCTWKILTGFVFQLKNWYRLIREMVRFAQYSSELILFRSLAPMACWWIFPSFDRNIILFFTFLNHNFRINSLWIFAPSSHKCKHYYDKLKLEVLELFN